jgi:microcystin-dependent protein
MLEPFIGELLLVSFNFPPKGWAFCDGQLLPINQNQALFSLLGTTYGGNGQTNFALPDLRGRVPIHFGNGHIQGEKAGSETVILNVSQLPSHVHAMRGDTTIDPSTAPASSFNVPAANRSFGRSLGVPSQGAPFAENIYDSAVPSGTVAMNMTSVGGSQPHENRQPYLAMNWVISLQGIFPSQN